MRGGLFGDEVGQLAAPHDLRIDGRRVADQAHAQRFPLGAGVLHPAERLVEVVGHAIHVAGLEATLHAGLVHLDTEEGCAGHGGGQGLRAAHPAEPRREDPAPAPVAVEVDGGGAHEGLVGALQDPLRADVDPRSRGHLAEHGEALCLQLSKRLPVRPMRHQEAVGDEHSRRVLVCAEAADGLAALHQERLVVLERFELAHDDVVRLPVPRGLARAAVHHQLLGPLGHVGVEVVHQHPQRGFLPPSLAAERGSSGSSDDTFGHAGQSRILSPSGQGERGQRLGAVNGRPSSASKRLAVR